jgi:hypothetical protein
MHSEIQVFFREPCQGRVEAVAVVLAGDEGKAQLALSYKESGAVRVRPIGLSSPPQRN